MDPQTSTIFILKHLEMCIHRQMEVTLIPGLALLVPLIFLRNEFASPSKWTNDARDSVEAGPGRLIKL